jgi:hypothetical protein
VPLGAAHLAFRRGNHRGPGYMNIRTEFRSRPRRGYPEHMDVKQATAVRSRYQARPGRRAIVITDLADLRGPAHGTVILPLRLYWSGPSPAFDLDDVDLCRWLYEIVLREAADPEELITYLNGDKLVEVWSRLFLPKGVRRAWEEHHPALRAAAASAVG